MNEERQETPDFVREEYSAPTYKRFVFETSSLTMRSGEQVGEVGDYNSDEENEVGW